MNNELSVLITTPHGVQLKLIATELTVPSVEGDFGVLPGHLPVLAGLRTGIVRATVGGEVQQFAVGPGFVQVSHDSASILTDRFLRKDEVDAVVARKELKEAEEVLADMSTSTPPEELYPALSAARWAAVCLELYGDPPPATVTMMLETRMLGHEDYAAALAQAESESEPTKDGASGA